MIEQGEQTVIEAIRGVFSVISLMLDGYLSGQVWHFMPGSTTVN